MMMSVFVMIHVHAYGDGHGRACGGGDVQLVLMPMLVWWSSMLMVMIIRVCEGGGAMLMGVYVRDGVRACDVYDGDHASVLYGGVHVHACARDHDDDHVYAFMSMLVIVHDDGHVCVMSMAL
ncbi:hypothetical protein AVEN_247622-1 [Araneus ventricosus]|uniref:Uncharacterized protein n=1 Tax=Araneus ventricosus TaxID=182803 RepID=A0A4Y2QSR5_ARAVE|nr:hypothetical protein AVEN_247622-1 [Araneus ventricosus]